MTIAWKVKIHTLVLSEDFKGMSLSAQRMILSAIGKKLTFAPSEYGKPLRGELKGYWKLRVGDYRVVCTMNKAEVQVLVIKVGIRRDEEVYRELFRRIRKLHE